MNFKITKIQILKFYIILYPLWDIWFTVQEKLDLKLPVNPAQIFRGIGMIFLFSFIKSKGSYLKILLISFWLFIILILHRYYFSANGVFTDISWCLKIINLFVIYYAFEEILKRKELSINALLQTLIASSYLIMASILLTYAGLGYRTYLGLRQGVKGFFHNQTAITAYLLFIFPLMYLENRKLFSMRSLMCISALFSIGSKTGVLGTILCFLLLLIFDVYASAVKKSMKPSRILSILVLLAGVTAAGGRLAKKYLLKLYLYYQLTGHTSVINFLLSGRNDSLLSFKANRAEFDPVCQLTGFVAGYGYPGVQSMLSPGIYAIERDFHGVLYVYGFVTFMVITSILLFLAVKIVLLNLKSRFLNAGHFVAAVLLFMGIIYAYLGGHIIYEAVTQMPFWIICSCIKIERLTNRKYEVRDENRNFNVS